MRAAAIAGVDLDALYAVLAELDTIAGNGAGAVKADKKNRKAKEKPAASVPYTGLPFTTASLSLAGRSSSQPAAAASGAAGGHSTAAACQQEEKQTATAADTHRRTVLADIATELQPASTLFRKAALDKIAAEFDDARHGAREHRETMEEEGSGLEGVERKTAGLAEHGAEEEEEEKKTELAAKYLFVHGWLRRLLQAAENVTAFRISAAPVARLWG